MELLLGIDSLVALNTKTQSHLGPLYHQIDLDLAKLIKISPGGKLKPLS